VDPSASPSPTDTSTSTSSPAPTVTTTTTVTTTATVTAAPAGPSTVLLDSSQFDPLLGFFGVIMGLVLFFLAFNAVQAVRSR